MKKELFVQPPAVIQPLALRPRDAAQALGISERLLWDWAHQHGLPYVQIGRLVLYPVEGLREWLRDHSKTEAPAEPPSPALHRSGMQQLSVECV